MWIQEMNVAEEAAQRAGEILKDHFGKSLDINKKGEIDLVTEADVKCEKVIIETIKKSFPGDSFLAEETGAHGSGRERLWIIDPLDGTTNFAHSFPFFSSSIALQVEGEIVLGLVYNPCLNEYFEAKKEEGAFMNKNKIFVSRTESLNEALLGTGFPYSIHKEPDEVVDLFKRMMVRAQGVRRPGAASIDLCYVACGRMDGFWEQGLKPWDTAAGSIIVQEAGGRVSDYKGEAYTPFQNTIAAGNPVIHEQMLGVLKN